MKCTSKELIEVVTRSAMVAQGEIPKLTDKEGDFDWFAYCGVTPRRKNIGKLSREKLQRLAAGEGNIHELLIHAAIMAHYGIEPH